MWDGFGNASQVKISGIFHYILCSSENVPELKNVSLSQVSQPQLFYKHTSTLKSGYRQKFAHLQAIAKAS